MIALAGFTLGKDIEIRITGLRPGEKLREELVDSAETICKTKVSKLMMISSHATGELVRESVADLIRAARSNDRVAIYQKLLNMGIGFNLGSFAQATTSLGSGVDRTSPLAPELNSDRNSGFLSPAQAPGEA